MNSYITWSELFQFSTLLVAFAALLLGIHKKK